MASNVSYLATLSLSITMLFLFIHQGYGFSPGAHRTVLDFALSLFSSIFWVSVTQHDAVVQDLF